MNIREITPADFEQVWPIFQEIVAAGETYAFAPDITKEQAYTLWVEMPRKTFVCEDRGTILGSYFIKTNQGGHGDHVCNCGYMVSSAARGRGLATAMCEHSQEVARQLRLKRDTVAYRIRQLERERVIAGYYTLIDYSKLGYLLLRVYLKFQNTTLETEREIFDYLVRLGSTLTVYGAEGEWDVTIGILVKSLDDFDRAFRSFNERYRQFISRSETTVFLEYIHYMRNHLVGEEMRDYSYFSTGKSRKGTLDAKDTGILHLISHNAKLTLLEMARELGMSSAAVRYRIKRLERNGVILGYRTLIDHSKLGFEYFKVDVNIEDVSKLRQLRQFGRRHPNIIYENRTIGGSDFEFDVEVPGHNELFALIEEIKRMFPGIIRTYKYYRARKIFKYVYFPE